MSHPKVPQKTVVEPRFDPGHLTPTLTPIVNSSLDQKSPFAPDIWLFLFCCLGLEIYTASSYSGSHWTSHEDSIHNPRYALPQAWKEGLPTSPLRHLGVGQKRITHTPQQSPLGELFTVLPGWGFKI